MDRFSGGNQLGYGCQHLFGLERFDHPGLGTRGLALLLHVVAGFGGQHDHGRELVGRHRLHFLKQADTVHVRHVDVADDQVDFLSVHATLSAATKHLIDESVFRIMKTEAFFINCARGALVDEAALAKALEQKWIAGAAVDVFEVEPVTPDNPLLKLDNIIVTPHLAGITKQSSFKRAEILVKGIMDAFAGKRPEGLVNPEVWSNFLERQSGSEETNFQ